MRLTRGARGGSFAPGLAVPYPALVSAGLRLRRGQTSLTVAAPGVGKSQLWANLAQRMRVPTLYWSADTDQTDVTIRTLAMWLNLSVAEIEEKIDQDWYRDWAFEQLGTRADHVEWVFDSVITGKHAGERLNAFATKHGQYPHLCVLDNLSNAIQDPANEYAEIKQIMTAVQSLGRETRAHMAVLHHAKGEYDGGTKPIPQSGGLQNPFKLPEVGLTLYRPDDDTRLALNLVKNRGGKSDPGAKRPVILPIDFSRARVLGSNVSGGFEDV